MATPIVYVICDNNCKYEGMTREQILTAIAQAVETGTVGDCNTGFITTIKTVNGHGLKFFVGTQAEYIALADKADLFAIITDDTTKAELFTTLEILQTDFNKFKNGVNAGTIVVPKAAHAENADTARVADLANQAINTAHLYYHFVTLIIPVLSRTTLEQIGEAVLTIKPFTSPLSSVNDVALVTGNKGVALPWEGTYYEWVNGARVETNRGTISSYTYMGENYVNNDYYNAEIVVSAYGGASFSSGTKAFSFFDYKREKTFIQLY